MSLMLFTFIIMFLESNGESTTPKMDPSMYEMVYQTCLDHNGYLPLDNNSFFRIMEVQELGTVRLPCSFCGESNEESPWFWKWRSRSSNTAEEDVELGLAVDLQSNRIFMYPNHTLTIQNVTRNDTGIYYCRSLTGEESKEFQFSVDVVLPEVPLVEESYVRWIDYQNNYLARVNKDIYSSNDTVVRHLLDKVHMKVHSEWDPWMPCDGCRGVRKRYAKCRVYPSLVSPLTVTVDQLDSKQKYLYHSERPSCHSIMLSVDLPQISSLVQHVPNFLLAQTCSDSCSPEEVKSNQPKYLSNIQLQVGSSMSFICPGANLKNSVLWKKNGINIKPVKAFTEKPKKGTKILRNPFKSRLKRGNVFVDRFSVLQLCIVGDDDTGSYNCYVDRKLVKTFNITVVVGEYTKIQRYYHYLMLSIYTSIISATVVLLGIVWAYFKRDTFPTVEEIMAAERRRKAIIDGIPIIEDDSKGSEEIRASVLSKHRCSFIDERTSKHEKHHSSFKDYIPFLGTKQPQKRISKKEKTLLKEKEPLMSRKE